MKIEELALKVADQVQFSTSKPFTCDQIVEFATRFLAAYTAQQEPVGWIDGEGDPYCQHGWGKKPPEGWTTCEENSYPVFRHAAPVVPADRIADLERQVSELEAIAHSDDGAGGDGMRLFLENVAMKQQVAALTKERDELLAAGQAVIDRWDAPLWKDTPSTAQAINALRAAIAKVQP